MVRRRVAQVAALILLLQSPSLSAQDPPLHTLLARLGEQVIDFRTQFSLVIGTERYGQLQRDMTGARRRTRQLRSDVFFYSPELSGPAMTVRTVHSVDGRSVTNAERRIDEALALPANQRIEKLRALANAGSSYNLGTLQRNFNDPTLALTFGSPDFQQRFGFALEAIDTIDGERLYRLSFVELGRPTVIRDGRNGADIPASGRLWITGQGVVRQTELHLDKSDTFATIRVSFRRDDRLGILVPATMEEDYRYRDKDNAHLVFISGHASYTNYRRFETSVRIVTP